MTIRLENDFHRTSATIRAELGTQLTKSQLRRANAQLCGMADCTCVGGGIHGHSVTPGVELDDRSGYHTPEVWVVAAEPDN